MDKKNTELRSREMIIKEGLERFLDDCGLHLASQNMERLRKHLLSHFVSDPSIAISMVHNYLQEIWDYNEYNIEKLNGSDGEEDSITSLIISSNKTRPLKRLGQKLRPYVAAIIMLIGLVTALPLVNKDTTYEHIKPSQEQISISTANDLKEHVKLIVTLSNGQGHPISSAKAWSLIKKHEDVTKYGHVSSYKDFNYNQYIAAKKILEQWVKDIKAGKE